MQVKIEGLEDEVRRILADVLAEREGGDPWYTTEGAAVYLGTTVGQVRNLVGRLRTARPRRRRHASAVMSWPLLSIGG